MKLRILPGTISRAVTPLLLTLLCVAGVAGQQVARDAAAESRETEIERLRQVIRDKDIQKQDPEQVDRAMRRLGDLRAVEAIDDLIELLAFKWPKEIPPPGGTHYGDGYLAKSALFQIGKPALPALARVIRDKDIESVEYKNARDAVMNIFREDLPAGSKFLRNQSETLASSPQERQRLSAAAQWIDDLDAKIKTATPKPK